MGIETRWLCKLSRGSGVIGFEGFGAVRSRAQEVNS